MNAKLVSACVLTIRTLINRIHGFQVGYTPTNLVDGELRPMADDMGDALVMHYELVGTGGTSGSSPVVDSMD